MTDPQKFSMFLESTGTEIILRSVWLEDESVKEELRNLAMRLKGAAFYVKLEEDKKEKK